jgi:hypothetical protein
LLAERSSAEIGRFSRENQGWPFIVAATSYPEAMPSLVEESSRAELRSEAQRHLVLLAGATAVLRDDQWLAIEALVAERRKTLVVQRTGWGKSAVYFLSTILLRARDAGPTVIISPLLSLMRNQIAAAERAGVRAVAINSANAQEWAPLYAEVQAGSIDALLISPERLNNPEFRDEVLPVLIASCGLHHERWPAHVYRRRGCCRTSTSTNTFCRFHDPNAHFIPNVCQCTRSPRDDLRRLRPRRPR